MGPLLPGIYTITNTRTGRVYVGQTARTFKIRWENHKSALNLGKHTALRLRRSWLRDGEAAFVFAVQEVVLRLPDMSNADYRRLLCEREQFWTDTLGAYGPSGFNVVPIAGSSLGHKHSDKARAKMSIGQRNKAPITEETRAKLSAYQKARPRLASTYAKVSATQKGVPRAYMAARNKARIWSPEARQRVADTFAPFSGNRKNIKHTDETRAKMRAAWVRRNARRIAERDRIDASNKQPDNRSWLQLSLAI
jgi:group I intron endonuclease